VGEAVDDEVKFGAAPVMGGSGRGNSGEGVAGAGPDRAEEQGEMVRRYWASGIWAEWCCWEEFRWGTAAAVRCRVEEERAVQLEEEGMWSGL
jgi:hypothetical protein